MTNRQTNKIAILVLTLIFLISSIQVQTAGQKSKESPGGMAFIPEGIYKPLFRSTNGSSEIPIQSFYLDICPVTNKQFLEFVQANPRWRRSQVKIVAADQSYLKHWSGDLRLDEKIKSAPVTFVSFYAAKAYANWRGKRLPSTAEWEYAAAASAKRGDGENDAEFQKQILAWYSSPSPKTLPNVGTEPPNIWGAQDLHGLVWEWTGDFYSALGNTGLNEEFCGSASKDAKDRANYPAFMRFGFRSSLKMDYTIHNLGFRCAKNLKE